MDNARVPRARGAQDDLLRDGLWWARPLADIKQKPTGRSLFGFPHRATSQLLEALAYKQGTLFKLRKHVHTGYHRAGSSRDRCSFEACIWIRGWCLEKEKLHLQLETSHQPAAPDPCALVHAVPVIRCFAGLHSPSTKDGLFEPKTI